MKYFILVIGVVLTIISVFANSLGLDKNSEWGFSRFFIFIIGICFLLLFLRDIFHVEIRFLKKLHCAWQILIQKIGKVISSQKFVLVIAAFSVVVLLIYSTWYLSAGHYPQFPKVDNHYVDLSKAFMNGQLSMLENPDPRLAQLDNPYDASQRANIPVIHDWSYYGGKYYLYWGPVPAVEIMVLSLLGVISPGEWVVLLSFLGIFLVSFNLLWSFWKEFFPKAWGGIIGLFLLATGLSLPFEFILGRPQVYETSIICGQFFLLLGFFIWFKAIKSDNGVLFALTGLSWGLALGSRYNLAISIGIFTIFSGYLLFRNHYSKQLFIRKYILLILPIVLIGFGVSIYNYLRFGSFFETGFSYQFTLTVYDHKYYSLSYILPSIYYYFAYPITRSDSFPIIKFAYVHGSMFPEWARISLGKAFDESGAGIFRSAPFLYVGIIGIPLWLRDIGKKCLLRQQPANFQKNIKTSVTYGEILALLLISAVAQLMYLAVYFYGAMRFTMDFFFLLVMVVFLVMGKVDAALNKNGSARIIMWLIFVFFSLHTVGVGFFGGLNVPPQIFRHQNPETYEMIRSFFNPGYTSFRAIANSNGILGILLRFYLHVFL